MSYIVPKTRKENFLAKIAGNPNAKEMTAKTRIEKLLQEIADSLKVIASKQEKFIVTFSGKTIAYPSENTAACDKTFAQIKEAFDNGRNIEARYSNYDYIFPLVSGGEGLFQFARDWHAQYGDEPVTYGFTGTIYNDGTVIVYTDGEV